MSQSDQPHLPFHDPRTLGPDQGENAPNGPGCWFVGLYVIFFGWWLSLLATFYAWLLLASGVGSARGMMVLASIHHLAFRRQPDADCRRSTEEIEIAIENKHVKHRPVLQRIIYTILIGWWMSAIALLAAWLLLLSVAGIPLATRIYRSAPRLATLAAYEETEPE